ncbi:hypothetical protein HFN89_01195 [Rhizobium laguerreae]|nr:hypothetical protein [Rhizobium laguerreae]
MSKITIDQLRQVASVAHRREMSDREIEQVARMQADRLALESGPGAAGLLYVSRMASLIDGFPSDIDLTCKNGHLKGAFFRFRDGKWGVDYPVPHRPSRFIVSWTTVLEGAMRAMAIDDSQAALKTLRDHVGWNFDTLADDIVAAAAGLHRHSVLGLFSIGHDIGHVFGFRNLDAVAVALAKAAVALDVNLGTPAIPGKADICARLANRIDLPFLEAMIEVGGAKPSVEALFSVVYAHNIRGVVSILSAGVSIGSLGKDGESLLHVAASSAVSERHSDDGIAMMKKLAELGTPLDVVDGNGRTAMDIIKDGIARVQIGDLDPELVGQEELEGLVELLSGYQLKSEPRVGR